MRPRIRAWLEETHGAGFELLRHFLGRIFESEMVAVPGEWQKVAAGLAATMVSFGIMLLPTYMQRFNRMREAGLSLERIQNEIRADELSFIAMAMGITALLTVLAWQSLFPGLRDCMALAGLPLSARQVFLAKSGALLLVFAAFVLALNLPWAMIFAFAISGSLREMAATFAATGGGCVFVFFSLLACQGVLLNVLPSRVFDRASLLVQAAVFIAMLGLLPFLGRQPATAAWWPPVWFARLWDAIAGTSPGAGRSALLAMAFPVAVSIAAYLLSYHRYRRVLLEARPLPASDRKTGVGSWLLELWIADPRQQAAFSFIWKTLARSRGHRLILLAYGGIALGAITKTALDMPRPSLRNEGMYGLVGVLAPLAAALLVTIGLRYLFSLPESLAANWIFRSTDRDGRTAWLAAAERFVVCCGIVPVLAAALPAAIAILGWLRGGGALLLVGTAALVLFETLFRKWQKLPFTCSYLPGRTPVWLTLLRSIGAVTFLLGPFAYLILYSSGELTAFLALSTFLAAVWWKLRFARRRFWAACPLCYEELPEAAVMSLELPSAVDAPRAVHASPVVEAPLFAHVTSRGLVSQEWADEIRNERRSAAALVETLVEDVRYALRLIRRNPVLSSVVVLTLTVGIGINASVFTVVNGLALRPHVAHDPDSFVRVVATTRLQGKQRQVSTAEYLAWRDSTRSLRQLAAFTLFEALMGDDDSTGTSGLAVSCNFFSVEGLDRAMLGRLLAPDDCLSPGQMPVVVIGESLWRNRFAADPHLIGRTIQVNNRPVSVAGVVPYGTAGWARDNNLGLGIWVPYTAQWYFDPDRNPSPDGTLWLSLAGRLARGYSRAAAQTELNILADRQDRQHPGRHTAVTTNDGSLAAQMELSMSGRQLMLIGFFIGTFNLVLFIACANVATLMLSRAAARKREIAVRLSLGAPRVRLVRMLVTESLLLAAMAGAVSVYLAWRTPVPLFRLLAKRAPDFPMPPDWRTFAYISVVVMVTGILAGLAPALESLKVDLTASLKGSGGLLLGPTSGTRLRGWLVSLQVALSMVLLVEAGLFARSEVNAIRGNPGYTPQQVVVTHLFFPDRSSLEATRIRVDAIVQHVKALPGVRSVAFSEDIPLLRPETVEMRPPQRQDATQPVDFYTASPGFFATLGIPIVRGREFQESDAGGVVVSQSLAKTFWPRQDPIGKTLALSGGVAPVVGVAGDVEPLRIGGSENPAAYGLRRMDARRNVMSVRFDAGAATVAPSVRAAIRQADPNLVVLPFVLQAWIDRFTAELWNVVALMLVLGMVGTVLATTGIYGAVSFAVNQRTRDLGIRVALGATKWDIIREVLTTGGKPVLQGLIAGLWLSVAAAAALRESVNGPIIRIDAREPLLYCGAALVLAAAAVGAMLGPARRGAKSDPLDALRCE